MNKPMDSNAANDMAEARMSAEEYTARVRTLVNDAVVNLENAAKLCRLHGDEAMAMDFDEAASYANTAIEEY